MMSVDSQNGMALQSLPSLPIKDKTLFPLENGEEDAMSVDSFHLQLTDEEEEEEESTNNEKTENAPESDEATPTTVAAETEDDILNKFDAVEPTIIPEVGDEQLEEKLLNDGEENEAEADNINQKEDCEPNENVPISDVGENSPEKTADEMQPVQEDDVPVADCDVSESAQETTSEVQEDEGADVPNSDVGGNALESSYGDVQEDIADDVQKTDVGELTNDKVQENQDNVGPNCVVGENTLESNDGIQNDQGDDVGADGACAIDDGTKEETKSLVDDVNVESIAEENAAKQQKANEEILKDQIMDTEDLLQIVDKETDEHDKEAEDNDKDSSEENSPGSMDKGDSDEVDEESEKMDHDADEISIEKGEQNQKDSDEEMEKMDQEGDEILAEKDEEDLKDKATIKDDDTVDIEEASIFNPDAELDKEYTSLAKADDFDDIAKDSTSSFAANEEVVEDGLGNEMVVPEVSNIVDPTIDDCSGTEPKTGDVPEESSVVNTAHDSTDAILKRPKRSLSDLEEATVKAKKLKLQEPSTKDKEETVTPEIPEARPITPPSSKILALNAIDEYMKLKTLKKLTFKDLEQIILQKICEAICHKSEIGELRHQLGRQEQMVELWRKEVTQLTKQTRDLEIVNKKLLHEVRAKNEREKPLVPVKITRSVGLQVRSDNNVISTILMPKRKVIRQQIVTPQAAAPTVKQTKSNASSKTTVNSNRSNINSVSSAANKTATVTNRVVTNKTQTTANKVVVSSVGTINRITTVPSKLKVFSTKSSNLLSKALQNSASNTATLVVSSPIGSSSVSTLTPSLAPLSSTTTASASNKSPAKPAAGKAGSKTFIDLTDEDDKSKVGILTPTTQGVRIVPTPVKTTNAVSGTGVVNPPRIMYVVNNQLHPGVFQTEGNKNGSAKFMLKFNSNPIGSANGVITTVQNGTPITMGTSPAIRTGIQSVRVAPPVTAVRSNVSTKSVLKHPAPLPLPPSNQLSIVSRKPIPPKPHLSIKRSNGGLILSWKMPYNLDNYEAIASYQLYAYQETTASPSSDMWRKVGDVKALALPMACTLTQFADGNKYHFAVRAVDVQKRMGSFSDPEQILL